MAFERHQIWGRVQESEQMPLEQQVSQEINPQNTQQEPIDKRHAQLMNFFSRFLTKKEKLETSVLFEKVQESSLVFKMEGKILDYLLIISIFFFITTCLLIICLIVLLPLKEKEPYLVTFATSTQNFALVQRADKRISANEALVRQLLGAYILNRESITHIKENEAQRFEIIRHQSSYDVWKAFENLVAYDSSIYTNENLTRDVKIINIAIIKKGYANADIEVNLYDRGLLESKKRYRVILTYDFLPIKINFASMPLNPTGFEIKGYSVTEIATLKELDEQHKVLDIPKSKIQEKPSLAPTQGDYRYKKNSP
ncbi:VirB8 family type IV secretion system protein [Helicobacter suis]|uniref:type IV secretion system protein n=1 Tax=Helicobacter suis TaxID=104628 RepID=UPI001EEB1327|nr:VirB8/TrbF family protein [Helicobacter suis]